MSSATPLLVREPSNAESTVGEEALSLWERAERDVFWSARVRAGARLVESCPHLAFLDASPYRARASRGHPLPEGEDSLEPIHHFTASALIRTADLIR